MIEEILKYPELVKAIASVVAGSFIALFTIYLLIKLLEKVIMKGRYARKAEYDIDEIKTFVKEIVDKRSNQGD